MAIVTLAAPVSGIRGKVGGNIYSANKAGPYLKAWGRSANPRTLAQTQQRANLVQFAQNWKNLTAAQRTAWDAYATDPAQEKTNSLGEAYYISGFAWYVALSNNLKRAGLAAIDAAPTGAIPGTPVIAAAAIRKDAAATDSAVLMSAASPNLTDYHVIHGQLVLSAGRANMTINRQWLGSSIPNGSRLIYYQDQVNEKFGEIESTMRCWLNVSIMSSEGRMGAPASFMAVYT